MDEKQFWQLINKSKQYEEEQVEWLIEELVKHSVENIIDFEIFFQTAFLTSYTSSLWGAAYVIMGGCSDDSFDYFRGWLIAQGKEVFEKAVKNPETLANYISEEFEEEGLVPELEEMLSAASDAYTMKETGELEYNDEYYTKFLDLVEEKGFQYSQPDIEFDWEDEDDLMERFPKLWKRFGENPLGY